MNKRIEKLFKRAGGKTTTHNLASNPVQYREYKELWDDNIEKFAELIIQECADVAQAHTPDTEECEYTHLVSEKIKEHFGVQ